MNGSLHTHQGIAWRRALTYAENLPSLVRMIGA